jgi:hypothetical protein
VKCYYPKRRLLKLLAGHLRRAYLKILKVLLETYKYKGKFKITYNAIWFQKKFSESYFFQLKRLNKKIPNSTKSSKLLIDRLLRKKKLIDLAYSFLKNSDGNNKFNYSY